MRQRLTEFSCSKLLRSILLVFYLCQTYDAGRSLVYLLEKLRCFTEVLVLNSLKENAQIIGYFPKTKVAAILFTMSNKPLPNVGDKSFPNAF